MSKPKPDPIDPQFESLSYENLVIEIEKYKSKLKDLKTKRNFVQQERELIASYYQISIDEQKSIEATIEKTAKSIESMEGEHRIEIAAFSNKYQHLEYEHENFINKTLKNDGELAVEEEEQIKKKREDIFFQDKQNLMQQIKIDNDKNQGEIKQEQESLQKRLEAFDKGLKDNLKSVKMNYEEKIKMLESDLELRLRIEIHELEERKNLHRSVLVKYFDDRMATWKQENINQIKDNINLIKVNTTNYDSLVIENQQLIQEEAELVKLIALKSKELEDSKQKHSAVMNRLAKYYNQEINMSNMKAKIGSLKEKLNEIKIKTEEAFIQKETLMKEISEIMNKYQRAIEKFKERAEHNNKTLDTLLQNKKREFSNKEESIEEILRNVDVIAREDNNSGFNRESVMNFLEDIKTVLVTKTQIINSLKFSISKATKVNIYIIMHRLTTIQSVSMKRSLLTSEFHMKSLDTNCLNQTHLRCLLDSFQLKLVNSNISFTMNCC